MNESFYLSDDSKKLPKSFGENFLKLLGIITKVKRKFLYPPDPDALFLLANPDPGPDMDTKHCLYDLKNHEKKK